VSTGSPVITSSASQVQGHVVQASAGSWSNGPSSFAYQWEDCVQSRASGHQCSPISGATSSSYKLQSSDVNSTVEVRVTATNASGSAAARSIQTGMIGASGTNTYYISYANGSNSNPGTRAAPWKFAPGMPGFAASYTHHAGDRFIFEGGDSWPASAFTWNATKGGLGGSSTTLRDYAGVETDWFTSGCRSAFCRPIFNPNGVEVNSGEGDVMIDWGDTDHMILDDIDITGYFANSPCGSVGGCALFWIGNGGIISAGDQDIIANRLYVHDWRITANAAAGGNNDPGLFTSPPYAGATGNSAIWNSTIIDKNNAEYGRAIECTNNLINDTVLGFDDAVFPCGPGTVAYNNFGDCGSPNWPNDGGSLDAGHADLIQTLSGAGPIYFYDNVLHDTYADSTGDCEAFLIGNGGETDYVYNNVLYNIGWGTGPVAPQSSGGWPTGFYVWNNTVEGRQAGDGDCIGINGDYGSGPATVSYDIENNLCVSTTSDGTGVSVVDVNCASASCPIAHNIVVSPSAMTADGYAGTSAPFVWQSPAGSSPTAGTGANLTSLCAKAPGLCSDTNYADTRTPVARPTSGAWDIGAYQAR